MSNDVSEKYYLLKAICSVSGGVLVTLIVGTYQCFGNMAPYSVSYIRLHGNPKNLTYMDYQTTYALALIVETPAMILAGYLDRKVGVRLVVFLGVAIYTIGYFLTAFVINIHFVYVVLTCGVFAGCAIGMTFNTVGGNAALWFPNNKGTASSLATIGLAISPIIFSPIQTAIINPDNLPVTTNDSDSQELYFTQESIMKKVPESFVILSVIFAVMLMVGIAFIFDQRDHSSRDSLEDALCGTSTSAADILKTKTYWLLAASMCFCHQYILFMAMNFKTYGQTIINDDSFLTYVGSFSSISAAVGRVIFGLLLDKTSLKCNVLLSCLCQTTSMFLMGLTTFHHAPFAYALIVHLAAANLGGTVIIFQIASWRAFGGIDKGLSVGLVNIGYSVSVISCVLVSKSVMGVWSWSGIFLCFSLSPVIGFLLVAFIDDISLP